MFNGYDWHGRRIEVREDKFGPPSGGGGGSSRAPPSPPRYEPSTSRGSSYRDDYSRNGERANYGGDSFGYSGNSSNRGHDEYRPSDRHSSDRHQGSSHDNYSSRHFGDSSMNSVPSGPAAGSGDQIYVRNLPLTTTDQDLKDLFRSCGPIMMTEVLEHAGRPKGSGVVRFESFESADKAVSKFNGWIYGGRSLEVIYDRV
ncbi:hypothetical protein BGZ82_002011 [Podila clonocystis]|nr:hypothetical protein BGZ82_002011 [Podila clonocystis]